MPSPPVERVLAGLERVRGNGTSWMARCPGHEDRNPSLSIAEGDDGRALLYCHAGCSFEQIVAGLGFRPGELFADGSYNGAPPRPQAKPRPPATRVPLDALEMVERLSRRNRTRQEKLDLEAARGSLTLQEYADAFRLDRAFLRRLGLRTGTDPRNGRAFVEVPYKNAGGHVVAIRRRHALKGPRRFTWRPGDKPILYGRTYLRRFRECGFATLVEGESDCHVLWSHRFPALGLPGATTWKDEWATGLEGLRIFVVQEPDQGGETLVAKLARSPLADRLRVVRLEGAKDPAQLHVKDPDAFRERFKAALSAAVRLPTPDQVPPPTPDRARPEIARQRPSERIVIDRAAAHRAGEALAVVRAFVRHE